MLAQLLIATGMVLLTVILHAAGLAAVGRPLRRELHDEGILRVPSMSPRNLAFMVLLVLALFVLHGLEIWLYAVLYLWLGATSDVEAAVYFSTVSYGGLGSDAAYLSHYWRLVGAIEGVNGVLLMGWSTAFFVTVMARLGRR